MEGHLKIVELLLDNNADVNKKGGEYGTTLQATSHWGHKEVGELLLENGADPGHTGEKCCGALHVAVYWSQAEVVQLLLQKRGNFYRGSLEYEDALKTAVAVGDQSILEQLFDFCDTPSTIEAALQIASYCGDMEAISRIGERNKPSAFVGDISHQRVLRAAVEGGKVRVYQNFNKSSVWIDMALMLTGGDSTMS